MDEVKRLAELIDYQILDTPPEEALNELAEIASAVCGTPMSLVSFIDSNRQWYKAKIGIAEDEVRREDSFCQFALFQPGEVMVVDDPLNDARFKDNPFVLGAPYIRFYAGAPLQSPSGQVMGTLCTMDSKPRHISDNQKHALTLLAKKAMEYVNMRKLMLEQNDRIEYSATKLKKLTDQAPGAIFQLEVMQDCNIEFTFISEGIASIQADLNFDVLRKHPDKFFEAIDRVHPNQIKAGVIESARSLTLWSKEFYVNHASGRAWYWTTARPEKISDGRIVMYGKIEDISSHKQYEQLLEKILHDVSHNLRRPVTSMLGLALLLEKGSLQKDQMQEYMNHVKTVFKEFDTVTRQLNKEYFQKIENIDWKFLK